MIPRTWKAEITEREREEALEKALDEVEEELWSHGTVGRDLADVHHNLSDSQSMTEQELETQDFPLQTIRGGWSADTGLSRVSDEW